MASESIAETYEVEKYDSTPLMFLLGNRVCLMCPRPDPKSHARACALSQLSSDLRGLVDAGALTVQQARAMMMPSDPVRARAGVNV